MAPSRSKRGFVTSDVDRRRRFSASALCRQRVTRPTVKRGRISGSRNRWAIIGASIGLVGLIGVVTVGSLVTSKAAGASARAVRIADAYDHAAGAIAAEESLERKYRLEPGPVPKAAHAAAEASLQQAMRQVAVLGDSADRNLARVVLREHEAYVAASARLFLSVDRHDPVAVTNSIDTRSVDPVFHVMEQQVYGAAAHHELTALNAAASVRNIGRFGAHRRSDHAACGNRSGRRRQQSS